MLRGLGPDALLRLSRPVCVVRVCARTQAHDGSSAHHFAPLCETLEDLHCKQESEKALLNGSEDKQAATETILIAKKNLKTAKPIRGSS